MAIIYSFPKKSTLEGNEIVLISDVYAAGNPSRNATISNIASYTIDVFSDVSAYRIPVASSGTNIYGRRATMRAENQKARRAAIKKHGKKWLEGKDYDHNCKCFISVKKNRGGYGKGTKKYNTK